MSDNEIAHSVVEFKDIIYAGLITNILSITLTAVVIITFILSKNLRQNSNMRYILYLIISNFLFALPCMILFITFNNDVNQFNDEETISIQQLIQASNLNHLESYILQLIYSMGYLASCFWVTSFLINLYKIIVKNDFYYAARTEKINMILGFFLPLIILMIFLLCGGFNSESLSIIAISSNEACKYMFYIPPILAGSIVLGLSIIIIIHTKQNLTPENAQTVYHQIKWYPITFFTVYFLAFLTSEFTNLSLELNVAALVLRFSQGILDSLIYGFNPVFRKEFLLCCHRKQGQSLTSSETDILIKNP